MFLATEPNVAVRPGSEGARAAECQQCRHPAAAVPFQPRQHAWRGPESDRTGPFHGDLQDRVPAGRRLPGRGRQHRGRPRPPVDPPADQRSPDDRPGGRSGRNPWPPGGGHRRGRRAGGDGDRELHREGPDRGLEHRAPGLRRAAGDLGSDPDEPEWDRARGARSGGLDDRSYRPLDQHAGVGRLPGPRRAGGSLRAAGRRGQRCQPPGAGRAAADLPGCPPHSLRQDRDGDRCLGGRRRRTAPRLRLRRG